MLIKNGEANEREKFERHKTGHPSSPPQFLTPTFFFFHPNKIIHTSYNILIDPLFAAGKLRILGKDASGEWKQREHFRFGNLSSLASAPLFYS